MATVDRPSRHNGLLPLAPQPQPQPRKRLSLLRGPVDPPLVDLTLGELVQLQAHQHGARECLVVPWTGARWTYHDLNHQSLLLAQALLVDLAVSPGDRVAVMAGNCEQYAAVFFAAARVGAVLVVLNNTYTADEAAHALDFSGSRLLFTTAAIGRHDNRPLLARLAARLDPPKVVLLRGEPEPEHGGCIAYGDLLAKSRSPGPRGRSSRDLVDATSSRVLPHQVCNLQFTSGTTGRPKAAMLTHHNLVNNARFIGDRMNLSPGDVLCCPPPLFHCFGLVLGLLASVTHGSKVVYPAEVFDPAATLRAVSDEQCTALHGVPAMFDTLFRTPRPAGFDCGRLRTGIVAGAPVPRYLMERLVGELGMTEFTSSYGLTEASPTCFNAFTDDDMSKRLSTVGTLMPHASAKIVDRDGDLVPLGDRGELCIAGYQLQAGYWNNSEKTNEALVRDAAGVLWLHTGDEARFDDDGYCVITGRFKDIIIRGGENIYPLEIEERLMAHPSVGRAIVVGVEDSHYGEAVAAFLLRHENSPRPSGKELGDWVRSRLGGHKSPAHVFWMGEEGVPATVPLTGSGKVRKFELSGWANQRLRAAAVASKL